MKEPVASRQRQLSELDGVILASEIGTPTMDKMRTAAVIALIISGYVLLAARFTETPDHYCTECRIDLTLRVEEFDPWSAYWIQDTTGLYLHPEVYCVRCRGFAQTRSASSRAVGYGTIELWANADYFARNPLPQGD